MRDRDSAAHVAHLLYAALIAGEHHLPTVARRSGLSAELLYKLCRGERRLGVEQLPALYRGTQDVELYAQLIGATDLGLVVTEAQRARQAAPADTHVSALHLGAVAGKVQALAVDAEADGLVTDAERADIERQLDELERKAESLRQVLNARQVRVVRQT